MLFLTAQTTRRRPRARPRGRRRRLPAEAVPPAGAAAARRGDPAAPHLVRARPDRGRGGRASAATSSTSARMKGRAWDGTRQLADPEGGDDPQGARRARRARSSRARRCSRRPGATSSSRRRARSTTSSSACASASSATRSAAPLPHRARRRLPLHAGAGGVMADTLFMRAFRGEETRAPPALDHAPGRPLPAGVPRARAEALLRGAVRPTGAGGRGDAAAAAPLPARRRDRLRRHPDAAARRSAIALPLRSGARSSTEPMRDASDVERLRDPAPAEIAPRRSRRCGCCSASWAGGSRCSASRARRGHAGRLPGRRAAGRTASRRCARWRRRAGSCSTGCWRSSRGSRRPTLRAAAAPGPTRSRSSTPWAGPAAAGRLAAAVRAAPACGCWRRCGEPACRDLFLQRRAAPARRRGAAAGSRSLAVDWRLDLAEVRRTRRAGSARCRATSIRRSCFAGPEATRRAARRAARARGRGAGRTS